MADTDRGVLAGPVSKLGFRPGQVVIEFGYDDDVDEEVRTAVEDTAGGALEDEGYDGVVDAVLLWWRDGDGDLTDELVDALTMVEDGGFIALLTPGMGRRDRVEPFDVEEACNTSGLNPSGAVPIRRGWVAQRLVGRK
ncbi:MAG: DUF3052 domain-containing protein [Ornithinimicrobium sp.]|uniref:DUF3052 domain-containing protein n=1 Tax=Ornithinimicrobium sp. TaxID=1977084 RepID=UPI003D9AD00A